ncbi:APC family permease [Streptomyces sp. NPDC053079]|uniref:APC family permease n=1 Tax=Streptomyces sp. NPDC053079 TaxID=3365697 RepID=UPI0037D46F8A
MANAGGSGTGAELRRDAVGGTAVLFQSVTAMAPAAAVVASIPGGAVFAGGSLPLSVLLALAASLLTASALGELARHLPAAGSVATYAARGLHPAAGFLVAWGYVFAEALVPPLVLLQLGFTMAGTLHRQWAAYPADLWWPWVLAGAAAVAAAGYRGIRASARLGTVLGVFEIAALVVFAVLLIVQAGKANTLSVFTPSHTAPGQSAAGGVLAGSVYCMLAFAGFEAAAPLAEEARRPRQTIRRAVVGAALGVGAFYVLTTYAMTVYYGPGRFAGFGADGDASWDGVARGAFGLMWLPVFLAVVNSCVANANAGANAATRTAYAFGRAGLFPRLLATVHPRHRSPVTALAAQTVVTVAVALALGFAYDPVTAFYLIATGVVIVVVGVYITANLACAGYFLRHPGLRPVRHLLIPALASTALVPALLTAAGLPVFSFVTPLQPPVSYAGAAVGAWLLLGVGVLLVVRRRHPERLSRSAFQGVEVDR